MNAILDRRFNPRVASAVAAVLIVGAIIAVQMLGGSSAPDPRGGAAPVPGLGELDTLVDTSDVIVIGRVKSVDTGTVEQEEGDLGYAIAEIDVTDVLAGEAGSSIAALDYRYEAAITLHGDGAFPRIGDDVLLFLSDSTGTIHESVEPSPHFQITQGSYGRYLIEGGELVDAPFSLDDVRAATR